MCVKIRTISETVGVNYVLQLTARISFCLPRTGRLSYNTRINYLEVCSLRKIDFFSVGQTNLNLKCGMLRVNRRLSVWCVEFMGFFVKRF